MEAGKGEMEGRIPTASDMTARRWTKDGQEKTETPVQIQNEGFSVWLLSVVLVYTAGKRWQGSNVQCIIMSATEAENGNTSHGHLWPALQRVGKKGLKLFQAENVLTNSPVIKTQDTKTEDLG